MHAPCVHTCTKRVFTVFGLTRPVFSESKYVEVFSGVEKKMLHDEHVYVSLLWLILV